MASLLFKYLKDKATDDRTKYTRVYEPNNNVPIFTNALQVNPHNYDSINSLNNFLKRIPFDKSITYFALYKKVLNKIEEFRNKEMDKTPYLLVYNDTNSIAELVALLYLGYSPILIDAFDLVAPASIEVSLNAQNKLIKEKKIENYYKFIRLSQDKLEKTINDIENSTIINNPKEGSIGIFSSGSSGNPKIIFVPEEKIINNILNSKYASEKRVIYNTSSISNISGLVTNVFMPFVLDNTMSHLSNTFSFRDAIECTDIYLPRNFIDSLPNNYGNVSNKIKRIFILGGVNNMDIVRTVRNKINLGENTFVNVYGCTECGGLISEFEEKDFDELTINHFDVKDDYVIYGYRYPDGRVEGGSLYKDSKSLLHNIGDVKGLVRRDIKVIPCGRLSENRIKIDGINIGECIVDGYHTGDIGVVFNDKIYILGRKEALEKQQIAGVRDASISASAGYTCSTITNEYGNLCIVVKYNINDDKEDKTLYFRNLITKSKEIKDKIIKAHNLYDVVFLTDDKFVESSGLKKPIISSIEKYLNECRELNIRLNSFDNYLYNYVNDVCKKRLGYNPKWTYTKEFIIFDKNDINLEQIVDLFNDLHVVLVEEKDDHYYIYYDDSYLLDPKLGRKYSDEDLLKYKECIKDGLLFEQLIIDNDKYVSKLTYKVNDRLTRLVNARIYYLEGINENGDVIIYPYTYNLVLKDLDIPKTPSSEMIEEAKNLLKSKYGNITFTNQVMICPFPLDLGYWVSGGKVIIFTKDGSVRYEKTKPIHAHSSDVLNNVIDYFLSLVARTYNLNYNNGNNKLKVKKENEVN